LARISPRLTAYWYPEMAEWYIMYREPLRAAREGGRERLLRYQGMAEHEGIEVNWGKKRLAWLMTDGWSMLMNVARPHLCATDLLVVSQLWNATWEQVAEAEAASIHITTGDARRTAKDAQLHEFAQHHGRELESRLGRGRIIMPPSKATVSPFWR
jgi:hypothetical protein